MNAPLDPKLLDRKRFLGGSDAAAILGVSPWTTPLELYLIKTGHRPEVADPARERLFRRGKRLEPVVVDMLVEELGVKVTKRSLPEKPNRYTDPDVDVLAAEIDFEWEVTPEIVAEYDLDPEFAGTVQNGEVKTVHPFAAGKFGEAETDEIPVEYAAQAMHGLMVTGRSLTMFAVLVGADNLIPYFIRRDEETIAAMRARELAFWNEHVLAGLPPAPVNLPDVLSLFEKRVASRCEASAEVAQMVKDLAGLRAAQRTAEEGQEELKFKIGEYMLGQAGVLREEKGGVKPTAATAPGVHELLVAGVPILQVRAGSTTRLDGERLKREHPEIAAACTKTSSFFTFSQPRKKGRK